jgi:hypothetical protein
VPTTWITLIGGVNVTTSAATSGIHPVTGLTTANGVFADLGVMAGPGRPFGGWIVVRGPSLPGYDYRVLKRPVGGAWSPMTDGFRVTNEDAIATADPAGLRHERRAHRDGLDAAAPVPDQHETGRPRDTPERLAFHDVKKGRDCTALREVTEKKLGSRACCDARRNDASVPTPRCRDRCESLGEKLIELKNRNTLD